MTPQSAMARGIALVPGDRQNTGSIPTLAASDNINLLVLDRYFRGGRLRQHDLDRNAQALMDEFDVRRSSPRCCCCTSPPRASTSGPGNRSGA